MLFGPETFTGVNFWGVLVASVATMVIGFLWYSPMLFAGPWMRLMGYDPDDTSLDISTPSGIGNTAALALLEYRHHDGSNQLGELHPGAYSDYTGFVSVNDADHH